MTTYDKYAWGTAEEAAHHAGESYERYLVPSIGVPSARPVIEAAALQDGDRLLDLGCGTGLAAERVAPNGTVTGSTRTRGCWKSPAARHPASSGARAPLRTCRCPTSRSTPWCARSASSSSPTKPKALQEMRRVLAPGGRAALGTPGPIPPLMAAIDEVLADHVGPQAWMFVRKVFSVHDPDEVGPMLVAAGFDDVEVETRALRLRVPPAADFFWQYVHSTPLAGIAAGLNRR